MLIKRSSMLLVILITVLLILIIGCVSPKTINYPPITPGNPQPSDGATGVVLNPTISWTCTDPNGDTLTYDVYFSTDATPTLAATNLTTNTYNPGILEQNTTYYWKVVAKDNKGGTTSGPIWSFKTVGPDTVVTFVDPNLEGAVRVALNKPTGDITVQDMLNLKSLWALDINISNLSGLEYALNLNFLYLDKNQITDISPLSNLTNLEWLDLDENQITDISPLSNLTNLWLLELTYNQITDISPLSNLTNLYFLFLYGNQITDISPLSNLTNLEWLDLDENQITDISPLSNLTNLEWLDLDENQITDISPLSNLTNLWRLVLSNNEINDITALVNNPGIGSGDDIDLRYNRLDLTPGSDDMNNINTLISRGVNVYL